jgi:hypothetical protein
MLLVFGVLIVFFLPLPVGPYTATNGPVTAMRAAVAAWLLLMAISAILALPVHSVPEVAEPVEMVMPSASPDSTSHIALRC